MHSRLFSPNTTTTTIIICIISIAISSTCYGQGVERYYGCVGNYTCGQSIQNLSYPFWGDGRPVYCGHPAFQLNCQNDDYATIAIDGRPFRVHEIDQSTQRMTVASLEPWENCTRELRNVTLDRNLFRYTDMVRDLFIYYNCTYEITNIFPTDFRKNFTCEVDGRESTGFYADEAFLRVQDEISRLTSVSCTEGVEVPVLRVALDAIMKASSTLQDGLDRGFEVEYDADNAGCLRCEVSGGFCGSDPDRFVCHCTDRTYPRTCGYDGSGLNLQRKIAIGIGASGVSCFVMFTCALIFCYRKKLSSSIFFWRKSTTNDNVEAFLKTNGSLALKRYTYSSIKKVTNSFRKKLGQGGYGEVYKGQLLDGRLVAVKLLNETKGNREGEEFVNEVASISRTSHVNVVSLLGYCFEGIKRALIYEYMANGSLEKFIRGKKKPLDQQTNSDLEWSTMHKIAVGIARGLEYLHRGCGTRIFHFDIKPHNILLDEEFCPKISDFGLAKLCPTKESNVSMLHARGTIGYIAPEVFSRQFGIVSHKADVYSYGMLVLDMVGVTENATTNEECVGENSSEIYFPRFIYKKLECDGDLGLWGIKSIEDEELARKMILVGLWCIQAHPSARPAMSKVIEMLEGNLESLQVPPEQLFLSSPSRSLIASSSSAIGSTIELQSLNNV